MSTKHMLTDQKNRKECKTKCGIVTNVESVTVWRTDVTCTVCILNMPKVKFVSRYKRRKVTA